MVSPELTIIVVEALCQGKERMGLYRITARGCCYVLNRVHIPTNYNTPSKIYSLSPHIPPTTLPRKFTPSYLTFSMFVRPTFS
ncbi:MAG: hypothetical protein K9G11_03385 [Rickettsiaceae bacterium]|nr:hypothetical protein [Rickettsiaceae bacterium]